MNLYGVLCGLVLVMGMVGLRRWRQGVLARAVADLTLDQRLQIAGSPWYCPKAESGVMGAVSEYARLYRRSLWPMRVTVTMLALTVVLAMMLDGGAW